jgi:hypothetical protein
MVRSLPGPLSSFVHLVVCFSRAAGCRHANASGRLNLFHRLAPFSVAFSPACVNLALAYITPVLPSLSRYFQVRTVKLPFMFKVYFVSMLWQLESLPMPVHFAHKRRC